MMRVAAATAALLVLVAQTAWAQPAPPELTRAVNDFAEVVDEPSARAIEDIILRLRQASGDVIAVATVRTFQPWPDLPSYAVEMFENHGKGIGAKGGDTGALVVLAVDDRQVRVEVGYGLEGTITDGFAGEVSRDTMVPFLRRGEYGAGLLAGVARLAARIAEARGIDLGLAPAPRRPRDPGTRVSSRLIFLMVIFILVLRAVRRRRGRRGGWASGVGAFGAGSAWSRRGGWGAPGGFGGGFGGFGGFGGGRSGGGGGGASW